jgi:methyltransferase (TIGR00027 family)
VLRAIGNRERDPELRNPDWFAVRLLGLSLRLLVRVPPLRAATLRAVEWLSPGSYHFLTARTRYVDQVLLDEVHSGVTQVVILGAGADTRAYRFDELAAVSVFELDHPLTSRWKQELVRRALGRLPDHVRYVAVDLGHDSLDDALAVTDRSAPVAIVWEGVTPYLDRPSVEATLASVGRCAPGSSITFDYYFRPAAREPAARYLRRLGEPFLSNLTPEEVESMLAAHGLELVANVLGPELAARQLAGKGNVIPHSGVAHTRRSGSGAEEERGQVEQGDDQGGDEHQGDQPDHDATHERLLPAPAD